MSNASTPERTPAPNTIRQDITVAPLLPGPNSDPCGPLQVYTDALGWIGGVYREEPGDPWQVCHTDPDGSQPVFGTFDTARIAAVALAERIEQRARNSRE